MPFDFPSAPVSGEIYTDPISGISYNWDGQVWRNGVPTTIAYVKIAGDTMTGPLILPLPNPLQPLEAAHKKYVDEMVATQNLWQSVWAVAANTPNLDPAVVLPLHGYSWTAVTADPDVPEIAPASLPGIGGVTISSNDTIVWNANQSQYEHVASPLNASAMLIADTPPPGAFPGQVWWDSNNGKQYVWYVDADSEQWVQISGGGGGSALGVVFPVSDVAPANPVQGMGWFCSIDASLYVYYDDGTSGQWIEVSAV